MASPRLTTIRAHRKRHTLSQGDVAYLLGGMCGSKICRYEMADRIPPLETAVALSLVFDASLQELFPDLYEQATEAIKHRARRLLREMDVSGILEGPKRDLLEAILGKA